MKRLFRIIPKNVQATVLLRCFGFFKIPLLFFVKPSVIEISNSRAVVSIPLRRKTRNHLNSMYFGALAIGADCAAGLIAMKLIRQSAHEISKLASAAIESNERVESPVNVTARVPDKFGEEPVARFTLVLSLKKKS